MMTKMKTFVLFFVALTLIGTTTVQAQTDTGLEETSLTKKQKRKPWKKNAAKFYGIGFGLNSSNFTDFATSPLTYKGTVKQISLTSLRLDERKEREWSVVYDFGTYTNSFNGNTAASSVKRLEFNFSRLYRIKQLSTESLNTKVGCLLSANADLRTNLALQNNASGIDLFTNAMGSIKITKDHSRKEVKEKKFLFWKYKLRPRKRNLSFRLNIGVLNGSYRNGYVYAGQAAVLNDFKLLDGYEIRGAFRMSSSLDYTWYLANKNALRLSYVWDAYKTGGKLDRFQMAHHCLKFTLLFNSNNR